MTVHNPNEIHTALQRISVDEYRATDMLRREEYEHRWYVNPMGLLSIPSGASAPLFFVEWQKDDYFETTERIQGAHRALGAGAILHTQGLQLPIDGTEQGIHDFYRDKTDEKRYVGIFGIRPQNNFPLIRKEPIYGAIEFESKDHVHLGVEALKAVLFEPERLMSESERQELDTLQRNTMQHYSYYLDKQRESVRASLLKVMKRRR